MGDNLMGKPLRKGGVSVRPEPEDMSFVALARGAEIVIEYLAGPQIPEDTTLEQMREGLILTGQPEARTRIGYVQGTSPEGIDFSVERGGDKVRFIPWGAVLGIYGPSRQALEEEEREARQRMQNDE